MTDTALPKASEATCDPMRVYVLWVSSGDKRKNDPGHRLASALSQQLDALGMVRDGIGFRIPVRHRSEPWQAGGAPRPIDLAAARMNVIVIVEDDLMRGRRHTWNDYLESVTSEAAGPDDLIVPVVVPPGQGMEAIRQIQAIVAPEPDEEGGWAPWLRRVTMYLMGCIWVHQRRIAGRSKPIGDPRKIGIFISHAKRDGNAAAQLVRRFTDVARAGGSRNIRVPPVNSLELYFDAYDTVAASTYAEQFEETIAGGALLAVVSDSYHGRAWCIWELLKAKQHRSPIVVWDISNRGTLRSAPYLGNVPVLRMPHVRHREDEDGAGEEIDLDTVSDRDVESILLAILSEALRMAVWSNHAEEIVARSPIKATVVCARPPELADIAHAGSDNVIVYPDPPINRHEVELIKAAFPRLKIMALSEVGP